MDGTETPQPAGAGYLDVLTGRSFRSLAGAQYNRYREQAEPSLPTETIFYEVPLLEPKPWSYLRERVYPAFARFLRAKHRSPQRAPDVIVSVFHAQSCSLISGEQFLQVFKDIEQVDESEFLDRLHRWLSPRTEPPAPGTGGATLLLPGPPG